jgi:uncharacterized membrane protein required for colicin V production
MTFNLLDLSLLVLLGGSAYAGYRVGPLKGSITLLVLVASIVLAFRLMPASGEALAATGLVTRANGGAIMFLGLVAVALVVGWMVTIRVGKPTSAKRWGRVAGAVLLLLQAALLVSAALLVLRVTGIPKASTRANSFFYRPVVLLLPAMFDSLKEILPAEQEIEEGFEGARTRGL